MKKILYLLIALLPFNLNANEMKVPFQVEVDLSKKGTVYETDFKTSINIWSTLFAPFEYSVDCFLTVRVGSERSVSKFTPRGEQYYTHTDEEQALDYSLDSGKKKGNTPISKEENPYFKLKVTLTPLGWASNKIEVSTLNYDYPRLFTRVNKNYDWMLWEIDWIRKEYKNDEKIEFEISIPLYGGGRAKNGQKTIMIADLQRLRNYHIRVESLEDVELPKDVKIWLGIEQTRAGK